MILPCEERDAFFAFFAERFSLRLLPCFLSCLEPGLLSPMPRDYAERSRLRTHRVSYLPWRRSRPTNG